MIAKWIVNNHRGRRKGCIIGLPGRGQSAEWMSNVCYHLDLPCSDVVCFEPWGLEWYPAPNGMEDQEDAVQGLKYSIEYLNKQISKIQRCLRLRRNNMSIIGFSAGAVMALQACISSEQPFASVVSIAGAILEPHKVPKAQNQTPILLIHALDDYCFSWEERYLPMKNALLDNGYNVTTREKEHGGHGIMTSDARFAGEFVGQRLGY